MPSRLLSACTDRRILIVGGSVRFLAASCHRAGWDIHAADRFGDADLLEIATSYRPLPADLEAIPASFSQLPAMPFLFTGGLENAPAFLIRLAAAFPSAAAAPAAITAVRSIDQLAKAAATAGLAVPETHPTPRGLPTDGSFLVKPRASVGGHGIRCWRGGPAPTVPSLWQRRCTGTPHGVSLLLHDDRTSELLGVCRSLSPPNASGVTNWAYAGSVTVAAPAWVDRMLALANLLAEQHGLRGAVGIDCLADDRGRVVVLEVNPRPTASMELHERTRGICVAARHLAAVGIHSPRDASRQPLAPVSAKAILSTSTRLVITPALTTQLHQLAEAWRAREDLPALADLPSAGSTLAAGSPVLTVFADGPTNEVVETILRQRLDRLRVACVSPPSCGASSPLPPAPDTASDTRLRCCLDRSSSAPRSP